MPMNPSSIQSTILFDTYTLYEWDGEKWVYLYSYSYRYGYTASCIYTGLGFRISSIGKIQSTRPLKGELTFADYESLVAVNSTSYWDNYTSTWNYTWQLHGSGQWASLAPTI